MKLRSASGVIAMVEHPTMQAALLEAHGGPFRLATIARPAPGEAHPLGRLAKPISTPSCSAQPAPLAHVAHLPCWAPTVWPVGWVSLSRSVAGATPAAVAAYLPGVRLAIAIPPHRALASAPAWRAAPRNPEHLPRIFASGLRSTDPCGQFGSGFSHLVESQASRDPRFPRSARAPG